MAKAWPKKNKHTFPNEDLAWAWVQYLRAHSNPKNISVYQENNRWSVTWSIEL